MLSPGLKLQIRQELIAAQIDAFMENELLAGHTSLGVGGPADFVVIVRSQEELLSLLEIGKTFGVRPFVLGCGTNLLFSSRGYRGLIVKLGGHFTRIAINDSLVAAGAGASLPRVARMASAKSLAGLSFAAGIPGTVGGAIKNNAGAFGREMAQVVQEVEMCSLKGEMRTFSAKDLHFGYRFCRLPMEGIICKAILKLERGEKEDILREMEEYRRIRREKQPVGKRTAGSVFRNPHQGSAARYIEQAGCKGLAIGGARISPQHANFIENFANATSDDIEILIEEVQKKVREIHGLDLDLEMEIVACKKD
ncbi:MAG: UDP-N-acetylenolpyruvoylglucosamine reductase [Actinobacteria bacterium]|nr:UDP-N-acetylenolpyruvoylglucosamine reductase [Actinomycetota bacterium]